MNRVDTNGSVISKLSLNEFRIVLHASRLNEDTMLNSASNLIIVMILSFVSYLIPAENFGNRLSMNLTLFLTLAALNLSISKQLPSSSYPTIANKFIMVSFIVVALAVPECIAVHAITTRAAEKDSTNSVSPLLLGPRSSAGETAEKGGLQR